MKQLESDEARHQQSYRKLLSLQEALLPKYGWFTLRVCDWSLKSTDRETRDAQAQERATASSCCPFSHLTGERRLWNSFLFHPCIRVNILRGRYLRLASKMLLERRHKHENATGMRIDGPNSRKSVLPMVSSSSSSSLARGIRPRAWNEMNASVQPSSQKGVRIMGTFIRGSVMKRVLDTPFWFPSMRIP